MAHNCESCKWRGYAEKNPGAFRSRLWNWHTKWCPGWKAYQRWLVEQKSKN